MSIGEDPCPEHPERTQFRKLRYCFSVAHHGRGFADDSQWAADLDRAGEDALLKMQQAGLLSPRDRKRLENGKRA